MTVMRRLYTMTRSLLDDERGFTLIEMVVAMSVSSLILIMAYTAHRSVIASIRHSAGVAGFYESLNLALYRVDKDLTYTFSNRLNPNVQISGENSSGTFSNGKISFVAVDRVASTVSSNPRETFPRSDIKEVGYYLTEDKTPDPGYEGSYLLMRREKLTYDDTPQTGGASSVLLKHVADIKFEFWLRNDWSSHWDSKNDKKFPVAVRTTLRMRTYRMSADEPGKPAEETFTQVSYLTPMN
jgi:type II secretion system protein J